MAYQHDYATIWSKVMQIIRDEIGSTSFDIWFSKAKFSEVRGNTFYRSVPNSLTKEWIESSLSKYYATIICGPLLTRMYP